MRLPATELVNTLVDRAHGDLDRSAQLWPLVMEHYRRRPRTAPAGKAMDSHADTTGAAVVELFVNAPQCDECDEYGNCREHMRSKDIDYVDGPDGEKIAKLKLARPRGEEQQAASWWWPEHEMRRAMLQVLDALHRLDRASRALTACVPAQAAALAMRNEATDGRTEAEIVALAERRRSTHPDECIACHRPGARVVASGFCSACYQAWRDAGKPERAPWIRQRRAFLDERERQRAETERLAATEWETSVHTSIGPADGVDRRAA